MTFVVSLTGFVPPPRFDGIAWTDARIEEAAVRTGPWEALETLPLSPIDADPTAPAMRSFTTTRAVLAAGWYRVVFTDGAAESVSEPVVQAQPSAFPADILPPIPNDIRNRSELVRSRFPADSADAFIEPELRQAVTEATRMVESITGRLLDASLPSQLTDLALRAVTLMTEKFGATSTEDEAEALALGRRLRSISAGPWSETYLAPSEMTGNRGRLRDGRPAVDVNPALDEVLWALMTEDARDEFIALATGLHAPAAAVTQVDWRRQGGGYGGTPRSWGW